MKQIILFIIGLVSLSSCDKINPPYLEAPNVDTSNISTRVLLEEYTGFRCGNCPEATEIADELAKNYAGKVILLSIHAGGYAKPTSAHPYDFRTPIGEDLDAFFGMSIAGNPCAMINRIGFPSKTHILREAQFETSILNALGKDNGIDLDIETSFIELTNQINVKAKIKYYKPGSASHYLCVFVAEDSVVQYQRDDRLIPPDNNNYVHNNVLRAGITSTWGVELSQSNIPIGAAFTKEFNYSIPQGKEWRPSKLKIIAFIHDNGNTFEILQVAERKLFE